jgi:hypothetical protein
MNTHADKTQENKNEVVGTQNTPNSAGSESTFQFVDNRTETIIQRKLHDIANNGPELSHLSYIQSMANNAPVQTKRMSKSQLQNMGFTGPHQGGSWQWNAPGGIHVTIVRLDGNATHFHVRKDTKGGVYNRINYNEDADGNWNEGTVNVPAGNQLEAQMKQVAAETIQYIKALAPVIE